MKHGQARERKMGAGGKRRMVELSRRSTAHCTKVVSIGGRRNKGELEENRERRKEEREEGKDSQRLNKEMRTLKKRKSLVSPWRRTMYEYYSLFNLLTFFFICLFPAL